MSFSPVKGLFGCHESGIVAAANVKLSGRVVEHAGQVGEDVGGPVSADGGGASRKLTGTELKSIGKIGTNLIGGSHVESGECEIADVLRLETEPKGVTPARPVRSPPGSAGEAARV